MKFKFAVFTLSLLIVLTMVPSAFAQEIQTRSEPSAIARANGFTEMAGTIRIGATGSADASTLNIDFGADITNLAPSAELGRVNTYSTADSNTDNLIDGTATADGRIQIRATGCFDDEAIDADAEPPTGLRAGFSTTRRNRLTLMLPACDDGGVLLISNVLLNIASSGIPVGDGVEASFDTDIEYFLGTGNVTVITRIVDPIDIEDGVSTVRTSAIQEIRPGTGGTDRDGETPAGFTVEIEENHARAFGDGSDGLNLELNFEGLPEDFEISNLAVMIDRPGDTNHDGTMAHRASAVVAPGETSIVTVWFMGEVADNPDTGTDDAPVDESMAASLSTRYVDVVTVTGDVGFPSSMRDTDREAALPLDSGEITVEVNLAPTGNAASPMVVPRFRKTLTDPLTVINIGTIADSDSLTLTYAVSNGTFDTGMGISNLDTSSDFSDTAIEFTFWMGGNSFEYTTAAGAPGDGLARNGTLSGGHTYAVLLSDLLMEANAPSSFTGYIEIEADAELGITAYISDWDAFSATGVVLGQERAHD